MIHYQGFCGAEDIATLLKKLLKSFGLQTSDITCCVTDCGADVKGTPEIMCWFHFSCLAHVVNLIVEKTLKNGDNVLMGNDDDHVMEDDDGEEVDFLPNYFFDVIEVVRKSVNFITGNQN